MEYCLLECWRPWRQTQEVHYTKLGENDFPTPTNHWVARAQTSFFLTSVALNTINSDYQRLVSLPFEGKGDTTLLYHLSLKLISFGRLSRGRAVWAQLQLDASMISIAVIYTLSNSPIARARLWHQLKT